MRPDDLSFTKSDLDSKFLDRLEASYHSTRTVENIAEIQIET